MTTGAPRPIDLVSVARSSGAFAVALGLIVLIGWALSLGLLTSWVPGLPSALPNSGLLFLACGVALLRESSPSHRRGALALAAAGFVVALSGLTLIEHATGADIGTDNPLGLDFGDVEHPGRPAVHTAAAFLLLGCALIAGWWRTRAGDAVAGALAAGAAAVVGLAVAGYLMGVSHLYGSSAEHGVSVPTVLGLVVVLVGTFALRPHALPAQWYAGTGAGEAAARRVMLPALVLPFVAGGIVQGGASLGLYDERFGLSLLVVLAAMMVQTIVLLGVHAVRAHEAIRTALEQRNREQERRFATLVSRAPVGIFETDGEGNISFVNDRWTEIAGVPAHQAVSAASTTRGDRNATFDALDPDDRDRVRAAWRSAAAAGRDYRDEFRFPRPDGGTRWVACHATPLRGEDGELTGFLGSLLDITDRREAEERTEQVVSRIAEAVSVIGPDGVHLHANDASAAILYDLQERYFQSPLEEVAWGAIDTDGAPVPNAQLPAEVTRVSGREVDERVLGFPREDGHVRWLRTSTRRLSDDGPPYTVVASFVDVTEERENERRLTEAQKRFQLAFDHAPIGVCIVSLDGNLLRVNQALCRMIGYAEEELIGATFQELTEADDLDADLEQFRRLLAGEIDSYEMEKHYTHKDGSVVWALLSVALVRDDDDRPLYFISQILDITERRRLAAELRHLAEHDSLTGLANRRTFGAALGRELARERRYGGETSLLMVDLDDFKGINDTLGHAAGDLVLRRVADTLRERVRETDLGGRLGGDEFGVLLPGTARRGAEILAIDLVQALRELRVDPGDGRPAVAVTASVGLACSSELPDDQDEDALLVAADMAMYEAKRTGRDRHAAHGLPAR